MTKTKKYVIVLLLVKIGLSQTLAQRLIYTGDFQLLGYQNENPIFRLYGDQVDINSLYTISKEANYDKYGFYSFESVSFPASEVELIHDDILLRRFKSNGVFKNVVYYSTDSLEIRNWAIAYSIFLSVQKKLLIFLRKEYDYLTAEIDISQAKPEVRYIPIKADRAYLVDNWLYFSFFHEQFEYSPWPHDIFRVKIGDWLNTELVFEGSEYDEWFLYPEHHVLGTDIELNMLVSNEESRESEILYNVETATYAIIPNFYSKTILRYTGEYYTFFKQKDNTRGIETIGLKPLPKLPKKYPYIEHEVLPREVWYNVPLREKTFDGTFITPYLLREASTEELRKLDKSQLRLLRNAIFAQYGYVFNSQDLQNFYNQFEWYRMMTVRNDNNSDIILLPEDNDRTELIAEVESGMN